MRLHKTATTVIVAVSLVFGTVTVASAGNVGWNNPDLIDISHWFEDDYDWSSWAWIHQSDATNYASGSDTVDTNSGYFSYYSNVRITLGWNLYEADKVTRSSKKGDQSQKKYVRLEIKLDNFYNNISHSTSAFPEKCKASTSVKTNKEGDIAQTNWNVDCKLGEDDFPNIPPAAMERLQDLFGKDVINAKSGKVKIKGKTDDVINLP